MQVATGIVASRLLAGSAEPSAKPLLDRTQRRAGLSHND